MAVVTATAGPEAFALTNAITAGNVSAALKVLAGSVTRRGEEFRTLGLIAWHLRKAMQVHQHIAKGTPPQQACGAAHVFSSRQREFLAMLTRRPLSTLQNDFRELLAADVAMKTGAEPRAALQDLVTRLCS